MFAKYWIVIALLAISILPSPPISAQEVKSKTLELTIVVDEMPLEEKRTIRVDKDADVFGKQIENVCLRVDKKTLALADVFVSTRAAEPIENKEPTFHTVTFQNGNFHPPALIASQGDRLRVVNKERVGILPRTAFGAVPASDETIVGSNQAYSLNTPVDTSVELDCSIYPWARCHVYVQNKRACSLTSREGKCRVELLSEKEPGKRSKIQFWHVYMQSLQIKEPTAGLEMVRKNYLEIDFDQIVDGQKVTLIAKLRP